MRKILFFFVGSLLLFSSCHQTEQDKVINYLKKEIYSLEPEREYKVYKLGGSEEERKLHFTRKLQNKLMQEGMEIDGGIYPDLSIFGTYECGADFEVDLISIEHISDDKYLVLLKKDDYGSNFAIQIVAFCEDNIVKLDDVVKSRFEGDEKSINRDYFAMNEAQAFNCCLSQKGANDFFSTDWKVPYNPLQKVTLLFDPFDEISGKVVVGFVLENDKITRNSLVYRYRIEGSELIFTSGKSITKYKDAYNKDRCYLEDGKLEDKTFIITKGFQPGDLILNGSWGRVDWGGGRKTWRLKRFDSGLDVYLREYLSYYQ